MLVDGTNRFARRTAAWLVNSGLDKDEVTLRLRQFPKDFVVKIGEYAREIRGLPKR